jgi:DNA (cytosine-5)-methyltransferase 1
MSFTFIDLFAGIGGFRIAAEKNSGKCVFTSEIDKFAAETYEINFKDNPKGDIFKILSSEIPDHDILFGGFPCQPFSNHGSRKGFQNTKGTLIFEIARILKDKQPKAFLLENVKGLLSIDRGQTFKTILSLLGQKQKGFLSLQESFLDYKIFWTVLNSADFGLAQKRERVFIVGFKNHDVKFQFPKGGIKEKFQDINFENIEEKNISHNWLNLKQLQTIKNRRIKNTQMGIVFIGHNGKSNTLTTQYHFGCQSMNYFADFNYKSIAIKNYKQRKMFKTPLINQILEGKIKSRLFTPRECARLQGFPDSFVLHKTERQAYKQIGNAVPINVVQAIIKNIVKSLKETGELND